MGDNQSGFGSWLQGIFGGGNPAQGMQANPSMMYGPTTPGAGAPVLQMPNPANPSGLGVNANPSMMPSGTGGAGGMSQMGMGLGLGQMGINMMKQTDNINNQNAEQAAHMNLVGQGNGGNTQMLQSLMQPTQLMNRAVQNQMNPQNSVQSLLNPQSSVTASQLQGLLH